MTNSRPYGIVGVQLHWRAWAGGTSGRESKALELQQQIASADEAAFTKALERATETDSTSIDRLQRAVTLDDRIVELREQIVRTSEIRFREGVLTASEYVDRTHGSARSAIRPGWTSRRTGGGRRAASDLPGIGGALMRTAH